MDAEAPFVIPEKEFQEKEKNKKRVQWANDREFFLACLGYCVGLGNVWRFSYLCYKNGGGAFLIPYVIVAALVGMPMYFLEVALGQFTKLGPIAAYNLVPSMKGIGIGAVVVCLYFSLYYIVILAWGLLYFFNSFTVHELPWSSCEQWWNTNSCISYNDLIDLNNGSSYSERVDLISNNTNSSILAIEEFWSNYVLRQSSGIGDVGTVSNWPLMGCFVLSWLLCYFCIFKGVKSTGKVVYFTATFPYLILTVLVVRGLTLEGAGAGIHYYLTPNFTKLAEPSVWMDAGAQVLFSYGVGFCVLIAFGSYNDFHMNCFKHVSLLTFLCSLTSIFAGFSVFGVLGHLAHMTGKNVSDVVASGPGLAFQIYPTAIALLPWPQFWAVLFFLMIIIIGIDSEFTCIEGVVCAVVDVFPGLVKRAKSRENFTAGVCGILAIIGLPLTFGCGVYFFELLNNYAVGGMSLFPLVFFESLTYSYVYGIRQLYDDIKLMIGYYPFVYFKASFLVFTPLISLIILVASVAGHKPLTLGKYDFPVAAEVFGWFLAMSSIAMIPLFFARAIWKAPGDTLIEKWRNSIVPKYGQHLVDQGYPHPAEHQATMDCKI